MADDDLSTHWEETEGQTAKDAAAATDQHFWSDADGAHVSSTGDHDLTGANLLLTSAKLAFRNALSELFSIIVSGTSAVISFLGGKFEFAYKENSSGVDEATISSPSGILVTSESSNTAEYSHTLTTAEGAEGFLPAGTKLWGYANISPHDDLLGTHGDILLDCKQTDGTENMLHISLDTGCKLNGTQSEPQIYIGASTKDGSAAAVSYDVSTTIRHLTTLLSDTGWTWLVNYGSGDGIRWRCVAGVVYVQVAIYGERTVGAGGWNAGTIPAAYRPSSDVAVAGVSFGSLTNPTQLKAGSNGNVNLWAPADTTYFGGSLSYPLES